VQPPETPFASKAMGQLGRRHPDHLTSNFPPANEIFSAGQHRLSQLELFRPVDVEGFMTSDLEK
jgi:hypothetical protein